MKEYKIGDKVWWAHCGTREVQHACPICFGKKKVTLILGDDSEVECECDFCGKGYQHAIGYVIEHDWVAEPKQITIDGISIDHYGDKRTIRYSYLNYCLYDEDVFDTEEEAKIQCDKKTTEHNENVRKNLYSRAQSSHKSYSWSVGYSKREIKEAQRRIEWHQAKIKEIEPKIRKKKEKILDTEKDY